MELNESPELNDSSFLAIGRQSCNVVRSEGEQQPGASAWSPMDCNRGGATSMSEIWHADWRPYSCEVSCTQPLQAQHRAKRQHCWGATSTISEEQGPGPSALHKESMQNFHTEIFGYSTSGNVGNNGLDFFQSAPNLACSSRSPLPVHNSVTENSSSLDIASSTGKLTANMGQGMGIRSFLSDGDRNTTPDFLSNDSKGNKKGKGLEQFHATSDVELGRFQESLGFSHALASEPYSERGKLSGLIACTSNQKEEEAHGDFGGAYKRKMSPVDFADASPFDSCLSARNEALASGSGAFGTSSDQNGFCSAHSTSNPSIAPVWADPRNDFDDDVNNGSEPSMGVIERTPGFTEHGEDTLGSLHVQQFSILSDAQAQLDLIFPRTSRRSLHAHGFIRRNSDVASNNMASSMGLLAGSGHWPALGGVRSPAPLPAPGNWGSSSGSRRSSSAFTSPSPRQRGSLQGAYDVGRFPSVAGRTLDWGMAAAAAASSGVLEHSPTSQLFASAGVVVPTDRDVGRLESDARISQAASSPFNSGVLASYLPNPGFSTSRVHMNPPHPVSRAPVQQIPVGPTLEASSMVAGQHAGQYSTSSPSHGGRREALFSAPLQSVLGLPLRGLQTLRADGEYRRQFLSEILNAMQNAFRSEDLNVEELVMLDPSIVYGRGDAQDQHGDMRLDVDNMTYEELLALEESIGNVSTGLDEERIALCLRESKYSSLDLTVAAISQDSDVKCSICQEEFAKEDELGRLDCGHGYHSVCIKQWLMRKNECPICKASAYTKP